MRVAHTRAAARFPEDRVTNTARHGAIVSRLAAATLLLVLAACAPRIEAAGPAVVAPALNADHVLAADGARIPLRMWPAEGEPEAVIVAVHGFNDYANAFDAPGRAWAERGITTYAYDQRGFGATATRGLWPGVDTMVADLGLVTELVKARHPGAPVYLVGESMGGAAAMVLMAGPGAPAVDGVVLVAPAVWGWATMNPFYRAGLWLGAHLIPAATVTGKGLGIRPSDNRDMLIALSKDPNTIKHTRIDSLYGLVNLMDAAYLAAGRLATPTLLLYGENDELVPKTPTFDMLSRLSAPHRVAIYPAGYHMLLRDLEAGAVLADVAAWIADPDAPLPSGNERSSERFVAQD
ncbi:MAG: alpha/beta hydrolase [Proteobacteria bacterium]|nr:alpha/beta hydrolase [Pseudomonadota bacterium]